MVWSPSNLLSTLIKAHWKAGFSSESNFYRDPSLPESKALPSVIFFAEYILSDTRQTISLPSVKLKTLGKNSDTRQTLCLLSALLKKTLSKHSDTRQFYWKTLGKLRHSANMGKTLGKLRHSANIAPRVPPLPFCRVSVGQHSANNLFIFSHLTLKLFLYSTNNIA